MASAAVGIHPKTGINTELLHKDTNHVTGKPGSISASQIGEYITSAIRGVLGDTSDLGAVLQGSYISMNEGNPHTTTTLMRAISGTARQINMYMAIWSASGTDPVRYTCGTEVMEEDAMMIVRQYPAGGGAQPTAEGAPARLISLKEDMREARIKRYGVDVEMGLPIWQKPDIARAEFVHKVQAQAEYLERKAISLAYETLQMQGTDIVQALQMSNAVSNSLDDRERLIEGDRIYVGTIFGAMTKYKFPVPNLMSGLALANTYLQNSPNKTGMKAMITPPGMMDTTPLTREDHMVYSISGLDEKETNQVSIPMGTTLVDKNTGTAILVHYPTLSYQGRGGAAMGQVEEDELKEPVTFGSYYPLNERFFKKKFNADGGYDEGKSYFHFGITDFREETIDRKKITIDEIKECVRYALGSDRETPGAAALDVAAIGFDADEVKFTITKAALRTACNRTYRKKILNKLHLSVPDGNGTVEFEVDLIRPGCTVMANNVIFFSKTGAEVSSCLVAFPKTGFSYNQDVEMMRWHTRIHEGFIVKQPEHIIIMRHVQLAGFVSGHGTNLALRLDGHHYRPIRHSDYGRDADQHDLILSIKQKGPWSKIFQNPLFVAFHCCSGPYAHIIERMANADTETGAMDIGDRDAGAHEINASLVPVLLYRGAMWDGNGTLVYTNNGHLGPLDNPQCCGMIAGLQRYGELPKYVETTVSMPH